MDFYDELLNTAVEAARAAGDVLLDGAQRDIEVIEEMPGDIKLAMDRRAEETILRVILGRFPDHRILAEECGRKGGAGDVEWVIDPLDGTTNYSRGLPNWCTCIGAVQEGEPVAGVVYDPTRNELFSARKGGGAFLNGRATRASEKRTIEASIVAFGIYHRHKESVAAWMDRTQRLSPVARSTRNLGSAGLHIAYVAAGRVDAFVEYGVFPWDVTAGMVLVREAGGKVSSWPAREGALDMIAAAPVVHDRLLETGMWPRAES